MTESNMTSDLNLMCNITDVKKVISDNNINIFFKAQHSWSVSVSETFYRLPFSLLATITCHLPKIIVTLYLSIHLFIHSLRLSRHISCFGSGWQHTSGETQTSSFPQQLPPAAASFNGLLKHLTSWHAVHQCKNVKRTRHPPNLTWFNTNFEEETYNYSGHTYVCPLLLRKLRLEMIT